MLPLELSLLGDTGTPRAHASVGERPVKIETDETLPQNKRWNLESRTKMMRKRAFSKGSTLVLGSEKKKETI